MPAVKTSQQIAATKLDQMSKRQLLALVTALIDGTRAVAAKLDAASVASGGNAALFDSYITKQ